MAETEPRFAAGPGWLVEGYGCEFIGLDVRAAFAFQLSGAESEACETKVWIEFAQRGNFLDKNFGEDMDNPYDEIIGRFVKMIREADKWIIG